MNLPQAFREAFLDTRLHDLQTRLGRLTQTPGHVGKGSRVAIYVMFPTRGFLESHAIALRNLAAKGYAPLVVTNAPLTAEAREIVLSLCWSLIERQNFGYDFGGYRAAILALGKTLSELDRLVLMNDSVWYPLPGGRDWLDDVDGMTVDFLGTVSNEGVGHVELEEFRQMTWHYDMRRTYFHYCSFGLAFGPAVLRDPNFVVFWRKFRLTNNKFRTIRRGEVGLSQFLMARGYSHCDIMGVAEFGREVAEMEESTLADWIEKLVIPEDDRLATLGHEVMARRGSPEWETEARAFLMLAAARTGMAYALPAYALAVKGHVMLKKSPLKLSAEGARRTLAFLASLTGPGADTYLAEAKVAAAERPDPLQ
ncbi:rhamnan synthesis F family protein [Tabrizicola sp. BL-A-41-H6]|uniref:rhamnan synthesis F family protein n=1 Tax=Tabrizicola sp. BL-A-41-H6 TaxID=3421107 RepID=UPI003D667722